MHLSKAQIRLALKIKRGIVIQRNSDHQRLSIYARAWTRTLGIILFGLACSTALIFGGTQVKKPSPIEQLKSPLAADRLEAVEMIQANNIPVPQEKIRAALSVEKDPLVRHRLNQILAENSVSGVEKDIIESLKKDPSPIVRQGAAQTLGNYVQTPAVVRALSNALREDSEKSVRYACALSLGLSDSFLSITALEKASRDPDPDLRRQVAFSLKRHTSYKAKQLLKKLKKDSDSSVRLMAGAEK